MLNHEAWLKKAFSDLTSAKILESNETTLDAAAYHTQQCAEKALKAYLVYRKQSVPKTHDLERLLEQCSRLDVTFKSLLSHATDLLPYAVYSRYPDDYFYIDQPEVCEAIKKAEDIFKFVKKKIKIEPNPNQTIF